MSTMSVAARRAVVLLIFTAATASVMAWWRGTLRRDAPTALPEWPPFEHAAADAPTPADTTPPAMPPAATEQWRAADDDGDPPAGFPVKVKESSGIYHLPGGRFYDRTTPDRWYATAEAAEADGYRRSKS